MSVEFLRSFWSEVNFLLLKPHVPSTQFIQSLKTLLKERKKKKREARKEGKERGREGGRG